MTTVYFVRHAEPNYDNHDDFNRELSSKGLIDRTLVTDFFSDKRIDLIVSSPYKRAYDTIAEFAEKGKKSIEIIDDFKERKVDNIWITNFTNFTQMQWSNFEYKLSNGESLQEVQNRNIKALNKLIKNNEGKTIIVGSHGTSLSTIINYYNTNFGYTDFARIKNVMPWIVRFEFKDYECISIKEYDFFDATKDGRWIFLSPERLSISYL